MWHTGGSLKLASNKAYYFFEGLEVDSVFA
jgi:hypothetical protein